MRRQHRRCAGCLRAPISAQTHTLPEFVRREHPLIAYARKIGTDLGKHCDEKADRTVASRLFERRLRQALDLTEVESIDHRRVVSGRPADRCNPLPVDTMRNDEQERARGVRVTGLPDLAHVRHERFRTRLHQCDLEWIVTPTVERRDGLE